jgi:hypothetical protein
MKLRRMMRTLILIIILTAMIDPIVAQVPCPNSVPEDPTREQVVACMGEIKKIRSELDKRAGMPIIYSSGWVRNDNVLFPAGNVIQSAGGVVLQLSTAGESYKFRFPERLDKVPIVVVSSTSPDAITLISELNNDGFTVRGQSGDFKAPRKVDFTFIVVNTPSNQPQLIKDDGRQN